MRKKTLRLEGSVCCKTIRVLRKSKKQRYWTCQCELCGRIFEARGTRLAAGEVRCQCLRAGHGHTAGGKNSPTYESWRSMKARCRNSSISSHGGSGIRYTPRWESFKNFLADMDERPEGMTIDRISPFGDYCKENCRWGTALTQANNKRNTRFLRYDWVMGSRMGGAVASVAEWARYLRRLTGNPRWTPRRLDALLMLVPSLNDLIVAVGPCFGAPEEFALRSSEEFRETWGDYLKATYLQAA